MIIKLLRYELATDAAGTFDSVPSFHYVDGHMCSPVVPTKSTIDFRMTQEWVHCVNRVTVLWHIFLCY